MSWSKIEGSQVQWAEDWEGSSMGEPVVGSEPNAFIEPKMEGILVRWSPRLGGPAIGEPIIGSKPEGLSSSRFRGARYGQD